MKDLTFKILNKKRTVHIDRVMYAKIKYCDNELNTIAIKVEAAILHLERFRIHAVLIKCKLNKRFYVALIDSFDLIKAGMNYECLIASDMLMYADFQTYGMGEFSFEDIGMFSTRENALNFRDYIVNYYLNKSYLYYSADVVEGKIPRFVSISLRFDLMEKFMEYCHSKGQGMAHLIGGMIRVYLKNRN